jgi:hypothetical protein
MSSSLTVVFAVKFEFPAVPAGPGDAGGRGEPDSLFWPDAQPAATGTPSTQEVIFILFLYIRQSSVLESAI